MIGFIVPLRIDFLDCSSKEVQLELLSVYVEALIFDLIFLHRFDFSQTKAFECVTNLTPWLSQMFVLHHNNVEFRRMLHETITNIVDICAALIDVNVR